MNKVIHFIIAGLASGLVLSTPAFSDTGGVSSLRGATNLDVVPGSDNLKRVPRDREPFERDYLHQPPLIPHKIRGYHIDTKSNKCLSCHSWKNYKKTGATKISMTHFETRDGQTLSDVSPRRYFCNQCHVPQADAKPLVDNNFKSVDALTAE